MTPKKQFIIGNKQPRSWEIIQDGLVRARIYSWKSDPKEIKEELDALAARFLDMPSLLKDIRFTLSLQLVDWRLKTMYHLIRFACWVGGVGGVDLLNDGGKKMSEINV